ncbi:MAG TPA: YggT family protein [Acidimicrobiales bacterium]|nr:YggT family protein [Acidimicrobiales bacterium]
MNVVCLLLSLYLVAIFGRIVLSWFPISPDSPMAPVFSFLYNITEPVLGPIRRLLPPIGVGGMGLDLSPIIVVFGAQLLLFPLLGCRFSL